MLLSLGQVVGDSLPENVSHLVDMISELLKSFILCNPFLNISISSSTLLAMSSIVPVTPKIHFFPLQMYLYVS